MSLGKKVTLNSGNQIPQLGFGTWQSAPGEVGAAVYEALKVGYRHLDLAKVYQNQVEVADGMHRAFKDFNIKREDVFITTKLWNTQHKPELVEPALDDSLKELRLDYVDLYLIHWPITFADTPNPHSDLFPMNNDSKHGDGDVAFNDDVSLADTWKAMIKLPKSKTRAIGVSNFTVEALDGIIKATGVVPAANQVERHPLLQQLDTLVKFCAEKNIHITAYSAFGNNMVGEPLLVKRPEIIEVAERLTKETGSTVTPAQVILNWSQAGGHSVIPKSVTMSRIAENFKEVELSKEDLEKVDRVGDVPRRYNIPYIANKPRWDINAFGEKEEGPATHKIIIGA